MRVAFTELKSYPFYVLITVTELYDELKSQGRRRGKRACKQAKRAWLYSKAYSAVLR
jgi:hypothetical protein